MPMESKCRVFSGDFEEEQFMSVSSIGAALTPTQTYQAGKSSAHSQAPTTNAAASGPKDADGDHDGDTHASDAKGLDVRG